MAALGGRWSGDNVRMDGLACPCGLGDDYDACCGRLHAGAPALTAEALMRSRYSAFAVGDAAYLLGLAGLGYLLAGIAYRRRLVV